MSSAIAAANGSEGLAQHLRDVEALRRLPDPPSPRWQIDMIDRNHLGHLAVLTPREQVLAALGQSAVRALMIAAQFAVLAAVLRHFRRPRKREQALALLLSFAPMLVAAPLLAGLLRLSLALDPPQDDALQTAGGGLALLLWAYMAEMFRRSFRIRVLPYVGALALALTIPLIGVGLGLLAPKPHAILARSVNSLLKDLGL